MAHIGALPVPAKPELYQKTHNGNPGNYIVRYPTVRVVGGRCSGSINLQTRDKAEAKKRMQQWLDDKGFETAVATDEGARDALRKERQAAKLAGKNGKANGKANGRHAVPALIAEPTTRRTYPKHEKPPSMNQRQARSQLKIIGTQLHVMALQVQALSEIIGSEPDE